MIANGKKVVVTGARGMLGEYVCDALLSNGLSVTAIDIDELDLTSEIAVNNYFRQKDIDWVVNCAAYTDVEAAEDVQNREILYKVNRDAVLYLAKVAVDKGVKFIHFSTDYVYRDEYVEKGHLETDECVPLNEYGKSKHEGENAICSVEGLDYYTIRISWLYGGARKNFVRSILKASFEREVLTVVDDQRGNPTYTKDVAEVVKAIIENEPEVGIYNFSGAGECSWKEFADEILTIYREKNSDKIKTNKIIPVSSAQFPTKAKRPLYSGMNKLKIEEKLKIKVPAWKDSLRAYIRDDAKFDF